MRKLLLFAVVSILGQAIAEGNETCELVPNLASCAENCLSDITNSETDCAIALLNTCTNQYKDLTKCYERNCQLADYTYAMNLTNTVCEIAPRSRQTTQYAVGSVFLSLTTIAVFLRLLGRSPFSDSFGLDDVFALLGYCASMGDTVIMIVGAKQGWGVDMWALSQAEVINLTRLFYVGILLFYFSVGITKLAILFFYLRIFTSPSFKRQTYVVIFLCTGFALAAVFQSAFNCLPPSYYWTRFENPGTGSCMSYAGFKSMPPINIALDVVVMVLPLPAIFGLNLPFAKKVRVVSMFCVGILIIIAGTLRLTHLYDSLKTYNITYNGGELSYYGVIESDVSVICTCMPPIAILLKRILPRWFGSTVDRGYQTFKSNENGSTIRKQNTNHTVSHISSSHVSSMHISSPVTFLNSSEDDIRLIDVKGQVRRPDKVRSFN